LDADGQVGDKTKAELVSSMDSYAKSHPGSSGGSTGVNNSGSNTSNVDTSRYGNRLLKSGVTGDDVKNLQSDLKTLAYLNDVVDGDFGPKTEAAVIAFQKAHGLDADGQVGDKTKAELVSSMNSYAKSHPGSSGGSTGVNNSGSNTSNVDTSRYGSRLLKSGVTGDDVKNLQSDLKTLGYLNDVVDGDFGPKTEAAVIAFQKAHGLDADGQVGDKTKAELVSSMNSYINSHPGYTLPPISPTPIPPVSPNNPYSLSTIVTGIKELERVGMEFLGSQNVSALNDLNLSYLRSVKYDNLSWTVTDGPVSKSYIDYVNTHDPNLKSLFNTSRVNLIDPTTGDIVDFTHLAATTQGQPSVIPPASFSGWAGDLGTLTGDVLTKTNNSKDTGVIYKTAKELLNSDSASFSLSDKLGDIDSVNISNMLKDNKNLLLSDAINKYYSEGANKRYSMFIDSFGGITNFELAISTSLNPALITGLKAVGLYKADYPTALQAAAVETVFIEDIESNAAKEGYNVSSLFHKNYNVSLSQKYISNNIATNLYSVSNLLYKK
ncbi:MAG: peptidoglycan-binding protein, partial [Bacillota bacterium]|nr:peptidoglycan-binding protein [Bacillota bacterium]